MKIKDIEWHIHRLAESGILGEKETQALTEIVKLSSLSRIVWDCSGEDDMYDMMNKLYRDTL